MKKKKIFFNDSKYDYFRKITNDEAGRIRGGEAPTTGNTSNGNTNLALPPHNSPPNIPVAPTTCKPPGLNNSVTQIKYGWNF